jgi:pantoate--beta-alanine ligase
MKFGLMNNVVTVARLHGLLDENPLRPVGFVPTMGALHEGHLSLVERAVKECPVVIVSIFVNPNQFNDRNDLKNYPRTPSKDLEMLGTVMRKDDIVFMPPVEEIYPEEDLRHFNFGNLDNVMEALRRPGHFNGVGQVVSKLFMMVKPAKAYFGIKDFQQLAVIRELVRQMNSNIEIVPCEIVREQDGLAMSSRNRLLEPAIRKNAPVVYSTLTKAAGMLLTTDIPETRNFVLETINSVPGFNVEYFEITDDVELIPAVSKADMIPGKNYYACIAVKAGKIRLIDNVRVQTK